MKLNAKKIAFLVRKSKFSTFNLEDNKTFYDPFEVQPVGDKAMISQKYNML